MERDGERKREGQKWRKAFIRGDDWIGEYRAGSMTTVKGLSRDNPQGVRRKKGHVLGWILSATVPTR